ncbi:hypothetical protein ACFSKI_16500 [Pseudogracilibacillus auburnensis]|uniref:Protein BioX n=1 Tax=Pseudogracilibacillus auburnensis TaxID=1494959 RepID=A0A2V3W5P1_9BACI|nr:hypothetical protein [Pseudogracilibacillus auburnensis]PXW89432.1 hypothetical protein DFR56_102209 [Pseudogracilibacillus auburnensis]
MNKKVYTIVEISLLASFIIISGAFKIPTGIPGSEFQMSAPIAIAICAVFGFKRYIIAGIIASSILFMLGIHTLLNIEIAMIFRIVGGGIVAIFRTRLPVLIVAGPIGTLAARFVLALTLQVPALSLIIAAIPGMIFTAIMSYPIMRVMQKVYQRKGMKQHEKMV